MLYYDKTDVSNRNDVNKTTASYECDICHYEYFRKRVLGFNEMPTVVVIMF